MKKFMLILAGFISIFTVAFCEEKRIDSNSALQTISEKAVKPDKIDLPFVDDPEIIGQWTSVDFVKDISEFKPNEQKWKSDLFFKEMIFEKGGKSFPPWLSWTKNVIINNGGDKTASKYEIKDIDGAKYMLFEWRNGDVTIRGMKPMYYVLKKQDSQNTQTIDEKIHMVKPDKIDLPFVDDPEIIGQWKSVDFVKEISEFKPNEKQWKADLFLKEMIFEKGGKTSQPWWTWTKNVIMHSGDKTASKYEIKDIDGAKYMFFEWKSGDVTIMGMKPQYYVLKKEDTK